MVLVDGGEGAQVRQDQQEDRDLVEVLSEAARALRRLGATSGARPAAARSASSSVIGAQGTSPAAPMERYSYQPGR